MEPKIRLKGFSGDWEKKQLSEILTISNEQNKKNVFSKEDVFSVSDEFGVVNQIKHLGRSYAGKSLTGYKVLRENQIVYTKSPLRAKPYGIIKVNETGTGIVSVLYGVYNVNENTYPKFIDRYFEPGYRTNNYLLPLINKGAKNTINISDQTTLNGAIYLPKDVKEQIAICDYLDELDCQIQLTSKKVESLKQIKSACLDSMFPQEGKSIPDVRFAGFKGDWELVSLKDITFPSGTKNKDNLPYKSYSISNELGFVPQNEQFENGGTMANADKRMYYIVSPDSFAYNPARINVGSIGYDDLNEDVIVSSLYVIFKTDNKTNNRFLNYWFKTNVFKRLVELYQEGGVRLYFFYDKLCACSMRRPSLAEQNKIADYFANLDSQIILQTQRLEKLKQIKSACLDNMFV